MIAHKIPLNRSKGYKMSEQLTPPNPLESHMAANSVKHYGPTNYHNSLGGKEDAVDFVNFVPILSAMSALAITGSLAVYVAKQGKEFDDAKSAFLAVGVSYGLLALSKITEHNNNKSKRE